MNSLLIVVGRLFDKTALPLSMQIPFEDVGEEDDNDNEEMSPAPNMEEFNADE